MEVLLEAVSLPEPATSVGTSDPRIEPYRNLQERDLVGRQGRFVAEGEVVLRVLMDQVARGQATVESMLLSEKQWHRLHAWLAPLCLAHAIAVYVAPVATLEVVLGFSLHRGILALGRRCAPPGRDELLRVPGPRTVLGVFGVTNHDNVGGIFRNAAAFGVDAVLLDHVSCDPLYRKALRVSVGGVLRVPFAREGADHDHVAALLAHGYEVIALSPAGAIPLPALRPSPRRALLLGAEGPGLTAEVMARATTVRLDMAHGFDSLNVATTSGIALYALQHANG